MITRCLHKAKSLSGNWVQGTPIESNGKTFIAIDGCIDNLCEINTDTLCHFTGERTEVGEKEIFENDLMVYDNKKWKISYCQPIGGYQGTSTAVRNGKEVVLFIPLSLVANGTVIGNIHDERKDE